VNKAYKIYLCNNITSAQEHNSALNDNTGKILFLLNPSKLPYSMASNAKEDDEMGAIEGYE
jgi:hypothetical protein